MSHDRSRRDSHRESHDPIQTNPTQVKNSVGNPIHPTSSTSTPGRATVDGQTDPLPSLRDLTAPVAGLDIYDDRPARWHEPTVTDGVTADRPHNPQPASPAAPHDPENQGELGEIGDRLRRPVTSAVAHMADSGRARCSSCSQHEEIDRLRVSLLAELAVNEQRLTELERTEGDLAVAVHEATTARAEVERVTGQSNLAHRHLGAVLDLMGQARKVSPSESMTIYVGDLEHALGLRAEPVRGKVGS